MQRYRMKIKDGTDLERYIAPCEDSNGDWVKVSDVLQAILDDKLPRDILTDELQHLLSEVESFRNLQTEIQRVETRLADLKETMATKRLALDELRSRCIDEL